VATYEINVAPSVACQRFKTVLENETFDFRCRWNATAGRWMLSVGDEAGWIVEGIPMVLGVPLLHVQHTSLRLPRGELICVDSAGQDEEAGLADLGARVKLFYLDSADIE